MAKKVLLVYSHAPVSVTMPPDYTPPLGVGYIAGMLLREGHAVKIVDLQVQSRNRVFEDLDFDFIGISVLTPYFPCACELIRALKDREFKGKIVIGGPHVTALPEQSLAQSGADYACVGEGEKSMARLVAGTAAEDTPGIGWAKDGVFRQTPIAESPASLDDLPFPALHLFDLKRYGSLSKTFVLPGTRDGIIITSRGCPFSCDFCFKVSKGVRFRSPESVVSEIKQLKDQFGYTSFSFIDDCFNGNLKRAKDICRSIIREDLGIAFTLPNGVRADLLDDELAGLMKQAGCLSANIGVEAWDDDVRFKMNKRLSREDAINAVRIFRKHGIFCMAYMIVGHYHDTTASLQRQIDAIKELDADFFQYSKFIPMPGSPIFNRIVEEGRIQETDFAKFSIYGDAGLMIHPTLSTREINSAIRIAYRQSTFRWRTICTMVRRPVIAWNLLRNFRQNARRIKLTARSE